MIKFSFFLELVHSLMTSHYERWLTDLYCDCVRCSVRPDWRESLYYLLSVPRPRHVLTSNDKVSPDIKIEAPTSPPPLHLGAIALLTQCGVIESIYLATIVRGGVMSVVWQVRKLRRYVTELSLEWRLERRQEPPDSQQTRHNWREIFSVLSKHKQR